MQCSEACDLEPSCDCRDSIGKEARQLILLKPLANGRFIYNEMRVAVEAAEISVEKCLCRDCGSGRFPGRKVSWVKIRFV